MKFDFGAAVEAKAAGNRITPGIKNAKFLGVSFANVTSQTTGDAFKTMALNKYFILFMGLLTKMLSPIRIIFNPIIKMTSPFCKL